jgi:hypothetical protein
VCSDLHPTCLSSTVWLPPSLTRFLNSLSSCFVLAKKTHSMNALVRNQQVPEGETLQWLPLLSVPFFWVLILSLVEAALETLNFKLCFPSLVRVSQALGGCFLLSLWALHWEVLHVLKDEKWVQHRLPAGRRVVPFYQDLDPSKSVCFGLFFSAFSCLFSFFNFT